MAQNAEAALAAIEMARAALDEIEMELGAGKPEEAPAAEMPMMGGGAGGGMMGGRGEE